MSGVCPRPIESTNISAPSGSEVIDAVPSSNLQGVGRMFDPADGIIGEDFDHCLDDQGNIIPDRDAEEWLPQLNSYSEISPSGRGVKVWVKANIDLEGRTGRDKKPVITLADFCDKRFEPWAKATFGESSPKTWLDFYRVGLRAIRNYRSLSSLRLDEVTSERAAEFAAYRQSQGLQVSTVNSSLRVLRRMLRLAVEWGELQSAPQ
jgi:Phage integrase SAM-like domain